MGNRGRPRGSLNRKTFEDSASQRRLSPSLTGLTTRRRTQTTQDEDSEYDAERDFATGVNQSVDRLRRTLLREINSLQDDFNKSILELRQSIEDLTTENDALKEKCSFLEGKILDLEEASKQHDQQINKQERFSRRSNVRIVGVESQDGEDCLQIATKVFEEVGVRDCKLERAHRDGKPVPGRSRDILVKCSFYQDKMKIMRNARKELEGKPYFIIDDLTQADLKEKRKVQSTRPFSKPDPASFLWWSLEK